MSLEQFAELPGKIRAVLNEAGIEVAIVSMPIGPSPQQISVFFPTEGTPEYGLPQHEIDRIAPDFMFHCFSMWAKEELAGRKKIFLSDMLEVPEGIDEGSMLGDAQTIPLRVLRVFEIENNLFSYRADILVTEFI